MQYALAKKSSFALSWNRLGRLFSKSLSCHSEGPSLARGIPLSFCVRGKTQERFLTPFGMTTGLMVLIKDGFYSSLGGNTQLKITAASPTTTNAITLPSGPTVP